MLITCWRDLTIVDYLSSFIISIAPNCIALDSVTMIGILFIYMISTVRVKFPCSSSITSGRSSSVLSIKFFGFFHIVLPLSDPKFGPSMSLALRMSHFVTGNLGSGLSLHISYFFIAFLFFIADVANAVQSLASVSLASLLPYLFFQLPSTQHALATVFGNGSFPSNSCFLLPQ